MQQKEKDNFDKWLLQTFIQLGIVFVLFLIILVLLIKQDRKIELLATELGVNDINGISIQVENIPIDVQFERYIDSLPMPVAEFPELSEETEQEVLIVKEQEKTATIEKTTNNGLAYNLSDKELLAQMMYAEEGVFFRQYEENPEKVELVHKLAGSVVLHRLENHYMGAQSLPDVLYAKHQYDSRTVQKVEQGQKMPEIVYTWAEDLLQNGPIGPDNMLFQAEFEQGSETYDHIGNQYFCLQ